MGARSDLRCQYHSDHLVFLVTVLVRYGAIITMILCQDVGHFLPCSNVFGIWHSVLMKFDALRFVGPRVIAIK
jgi:hypothetical protein